MKKHKIKNRHLARVVDMVLSLNRLDVPVYAANAAYFIILPAFLMQPQHKSALS